MILSKTNKKKYNKIINKKINFFLNQFKKNNFLIVIIINYIIIIYKMIINICNNII